MRKKYLRLYLLFICITALLTIDLQSKIIVKAATSKTYHFVVGATNVNNGDEFKVINAETQIYVCDSDGNVVTNDDIIWKSSNEEVIKVTPDTTYDHIANLKRVAPGFAMITAMVTDGSTIYNISCNVQVELEILFGDDPATTTPHQSSLTTGYDVMALEVGNTQKVFLKYKTSDPINDNTLVSWKSSNEDVATVDKEGNVKALTSGATTITITTNTAGTDKKPQTVTLYVVVSPKAYNTATSQYEKDFTITGQSNYTIITNAKKATNLTWVIKDSKGQILAADSSLMKYHLSETSGNLEISNAKAGTYEIYAFNSVNGYYGETVNIPYLHIKFIVPFSVTKNSVIMNVGDTYSLLDNSNVPSSDVLNYKFNSGSSFVSIYSGVVTAKAKGETNITLTYASESQNINIQIIDGIALNMTDATIYTAGTLQLMALTTDSSYKVTWTSSDDKIATVVDGKVTGVAKGQAVITATQVINGVTKTATCTVNVQQTVTKITLDPSTVTANIGEYYTLYAKVEPEGLNNVSLKWISTNESIVKITDKGSKTATIQAVAGGTAVITAINQDNIVVGTCTVTVKNKVTGITLSDSNVTVNLSSKTVQIRSVISPQDATNKNLSWRSTNTSVATVDQYGLVTLVSAGNTSIIATSEDSPTVMAICNVTVISSISSITLDETSKTMYVGDSTRLTYTVLPTNASTQNLSWSSSDPSVISVDSTGLVKAVAAGQAVVILKTSDGLMKTCTITVKVKATGVTLDVQNLELEVGQTYTLKPTITPANSTEVTLTWDSSDSGIAAVDTNGKVSAKAKGKAIISAKTSLGGIVYCYVTVTQPVTGIKLNYDEKTIVKGDSVTIKASVLPSAASNRSVTWKSSKTKVATVSTSGVVKGLASGSTVITCTTKDGEYVATCVIQVIEKVTSIKLNKTSLKLGIYKSYTLKATVKTNAATNPKITWVSSNKSIATVNSSGKVYGKKIGYVTIYAKANDGSKVVASCDIRVVRGVSAIKINRTSVTTVEGRSFQLKATVSPINATYKTVKWTTSDENIAIVDSYGNVTALKEGKVTITASAKDSSNKKAACIVMVKPQSPATSVTIINQSITMIQGETAVLQKAIYPTTSTDRFTWESDNKTVASVDKSTGRVYAKTPGTANITIMTESGKTATAKITVVGLNTRSIVIEQYSKYQLTVIGIDSSSNITVTWDITDPNIATVSNGLVKSKKIGTTTIIATVNGRRLTCNLKVTKIN